MAHRTHNNLCGYVVRGTFLLVLVSRHSDPVIIRRTLNTNSMCTLLIFHKSGHWQVFREAAKDLQASSLKDMRFLRASNLPTLLLHVATGFLFFVKANEDDIWALIVYCHLSRPSFVQRSLFEDSIRSILSRSGSRNDFRSTSKLTFAFGQPLAETIDNKKDVRVGTHFLMMPRALTIV
jgi:hypothetical protein